MSFVIYKFSYQVLHVNANVCLYTQMQVKNHTDLFILHYTMFLHSPSSPSFYPPSAPSPRHSCRERRSDACLSVTWWIVMNRDCVSIWGEAGGRQRGYGKGLWGRRRKRSGRGIDCESGGKKGASFTVANTDINTLHRFHDCFSPTAHRLSETKPLGHHRSLKPDTACSFSAGDVALFCLLK